jgi:hypothetical protein
MYPALPARLTDRPCAIVVLAVLRGATRNASCRLLRAQRAYAAFHDASAESFFIDIRV